MALVSFAWLASASELTHREIERQAREIGMVYREEIVPWKDQAPGTSKEAIAANQGLSQPGAEVMTNQQGTNIEGEDNGSVEIRPGSSLEQIALLLEEKQLIDDSSTFMQLVKEQGLSQKIIAGTYRIEPGAGYQEILEVITEGLYRRTGESSQ